MNYTIKRTIIVLVAAVLALVCIAAGSRTYAATAFELDKTEIVFGGPTEPGQDMSEPVDVNIKKGSPDIKDAVSDNKAVAVIMELGPDYILVQPKGEGSCTVTVTSVDGDVIPIPVTVTEEWLKAEFKQRTFVSEAFYGEKRITICSYPGASGTLKVGKDKYKIDEVGPSGLYRVKLKKANKFNKTIYLTMTLRGTTYTVKDKTTSPVELRYAKVRSENRKQIYISCKSLHKDDIVTVKYKGKVRNIIVKGNYFRKNCKLLFKFKTKFKKNSKITVKVFTKYGQKMCSKTVKLKDWKYYF